MTLGFVGSELADGLGAQLVVVPLELELWLGEHRIQAF